jgi:hypothetical protein
MTLIPDLLIEPLKVKLNLIWKQLEQTEAQPLKSLVETKRQLQREKLKFRSFLIQKQQWVNLSQQMPQLLV